LVLVFIGVSPACAGAAQPGRRLSLVARDVQTVSSDGQRYFAFQQQQKITVLDTKTGRRYVPAPAGCGLPKASPPVSHVVSFPEVLVSCAPDGGAIRLLDARSGAMIALPPGGWNRLGRDWVEQDGLTSCPDGSGMCEPFYEWHTGVTKYLSESQLDRVLADRAAAAPDSGDRTRPVRVDRAAFADPRTRDRSRSERRQRQLGRDDPGLRLRHSDQADVQLGAAGRERQVRDTRGRTPHGLRRPRRADDAG